ncbi:hypothetical protein [Microbacterium enclense]|uniref:hypothetical protein n=1 Tax=Microbacterium enclense TaxID=993073 RepID=UPI003415BF68
MRSTGFTKPQLATLRTRDNDRCVWTGNHTDRLIPQHRVNRGMGGNRHLNVLTNGLLLDSIINGLIESDPTLGVVAKAFGIKVERWADPTDVPVFYAHEHAWYALEGDTRREISGVQAVEQMQAVYGPEWFEWWAVATETAHSRALANLGGW